jgi:hypothetical protein
MTIRILGPLAQAARETAEKMGDEPLRECMPAFFVSRDPRLPGLVPLAEFEHGGEKFFIMTEEER